MIACLNPTCPAPHNFDTALLCQGCGSALWLQDRYRPIQLLGQREFGQAWLAIDNVNQQLCVIKQGLPKAEVAGEEARSLPRFQQEAQLLADLGEHPQIPALVDCFHHNQIAYLVQEFIPGINLGQEIAEQGTFSERQIWQLLADLLPVLQFIHQHQIIHRDIKPTHIIRRSSPSPLASSCLTMVDFGAAKRLTPADWLQPDVSVGSPEYVAPEQAKGKAVFASDLYSLGVTCIHLLTQIPPFDLCDTINNGWIWRQFLPNPVSNSLAHVLDQLLENNLTRRFQSADQVIAVIQTGKAGDGFRQSFDSLPSPQLSAEAEVSIECSAAGELGEFKTQNSLAQQHEVLLKTSPPFHLTLTLIGHSASVNAVALSPDAAILASGSDDKTVRLWQAQTGKPLGTLLGHSQAVMCVAFSPDGQRLASAGNDKTIQVWDWRSQQLMHTLTGHRQAVKSIAFSPDGKFLVSGSWDKTIKLWDCQTNQIIGTLSGHSLQVTAIALSADHQWLASASCDRTVQLWHLPLPLHSPAFPSFTLTAHTRSALAVAFSPDSKTLATSSDDRTIHLWEVGTGTLIRTLPGHSWAVVALAFSPDGKTLISSGWDTPIKFWDLTACTSEAEVSNLEGHSDSVHAIALSSDGQVLVSGSRDKTVKLFVPNQK